MFCTAYNFALTNKHPHYCFKKQYQKFSVSINSQRSKKKINFFFTETSDSSSHLAVIMNAKIYGNQVHKQEKVA